MLKIKKNDTVKVLTGRDKGKTGKILKVFPGTNRVVVQGVNLIKKHQRKTSQEQQGGVQEKESTVSISNLMVICPKCSRPTRIGKTLLSDGMKARICKKCQEILT